MSLEQVVWEAVVKPQVLRIGSQTPADGVDQGWGQYSLCPSRPLPRDLAHLTALCASYTDKPLCACPAQLLPSKPDGSLNGVLSSLLRFLLQKHMWKTKLQSLDRPPPSLSAIELPLQSLIYHTHGYSSLPGSQEKDLEHPMVPPSPTPTSAPPANPVCLCLRHTSGIQAYLNPL